MLKKSPKAGFWKIDKRMKLKGYSFNHKRMYRVYCRLGLNLPRRTRRTLPKRPRGPLSVELKVNPQWALDFMHDTLYCGKRIRVLNIIDEGTREALDISIAASLPAGRVVRVLDALVAEHGKPRRIRVDNGAEMTSTTFVEWCERQKIQIVYIQPGKPNQNAYIERFNRSFRMRYLMPICLGH